MSECAYHALNKRACRWNGDSSDGKVARPASTNLSVSLQLALCCGQSATVGG
jgi:hypothetical protein